MSLLSEKNIIESLHHFSEIPSEKCWESIAQNLPPLVSPSAGNTNVDPSSTSHSFSQFFGGIAGKITAIATTAIIATSIGLFYYSNLKNEPTNEKIAKTEIIKTTEDSIDKTTEINIIKNSPKNNFTPEKTDKIPTENKIEVDKKEKASEQKNTLTEKSSIPQASQIEKRIKKDTLSPNASSNQTKNSTKILNQKQEPINQNPKINEELIPNVESEMISKNTNDTPPIISKSNIIEKLDVSQIVVPNIFTPNNDGYNDYFVFKNLENFQKNRLIVVGSKGNKVYERYQYDNSWDAPNLPDGSYFFILEISDNNLSSTIQGVVQVLR